MSDVTIYFHSAYGPYRQLSNEFMQKDSLVWNGKTYPSGEHLFQARRFDYPGASEDSIEYAEHIRQASTPFKAKMLGIMRRTHRKFKWQVEMGKIIIKYQRRGVEPRPDFVNIRLDVMLEVLMLKFTTDRECRDVLLSTDYNDIAEKSDWFWGCGTTNSPGQNWMGRLLMQVRTTIKNLNHIRRHRRLFSSCMDL